MEKNQGRWYFIGMHGALGLFALLVVLLVVENRKLEADLYKASLKAAGGPKIEEVAPAVAVKSLDGEDSMLDWDGESKDSVVLVFTTTCPACQRNVEPWNDLHRQFADRYRFVAIGLDPLEATRSYAEENAMPFEVVIPADRSSFQRDYGITTVPQTLVIGEDGRVKDVQPGVLPPAFHDRLG